MTASVRGTQYDKQLDELLKYDYFSVFGEKDIGWGVFLPAVSVLALLCFASGLSVAGGEIKVYVAYQMAIVVFVSLLMTPVAIIFRLVFDVQLIQSRRLVFLFVTHATVSMFAFVIAVIYFGANLPYWDALDESSIYYCGIGFGLVFLISILRLLRGQVDNISFLNEDKNIIWRNIFSLISIAFVVNFANYQLFAKVLFAPQGEFVPSMFERLSGLFN
ncbi:hypothetical protein [Roseibium sp.]|uniref:hypothetical protein n=1 Tax=Roseibium sp. TaxID=1936156 RepID=UPI003BAF3402